VKNIILKIAVAALVAALIQPAVAAEPENQRMVIEGGGGVVMVDELGAILIYKDGQLGVEYPGEASGRLEKYQDVDLQKGDEILMINGTKVTTIDKFETKYHIIEPGQDVKLGVRRDGDQMMIIKFPRAAEDELPEKKMMMVTMDEGDDGQLVTTTHDGQKSRVMAHDADAIVPLIELGLILEDTDGKLVVADVMPELRDKSKAEDIIEGDILVSVNGAEMDSKDAYIEAVDDLEPGTKMNFVFERDGKKIEFEHEKADNKFKIIKDSH